jgi:glutamyl-tRNA synthetase
LAYPAFDTPEELAELRAEAEARKETFKYRRPADWDRDRALGRLREGESCVIRFAAPDEAIVVKDEVLGEVRFDGGELEDFVIRKADGYPTYHFAVVVDDALMGVTHVLRGQEHLMNTPKHVALQEAMGLPVPHYAHLPLIFNPDGSKMSKRDKDKAVRAEARRHEGTEARSGELGISAEEYRAWLGDKTRQLPADVLRVLAKRLGVVLPEIDVDDFRRSGYLPEVVLNYIALLGWNPGEKNADGTDVERFGMDYLASHFSIERIGKKASKFDREKLRAFNADRVQKELSAVEFAAAWRGWLERYDAGTLAALGDRFELAAKAVQARTTTLADAIEPVRFAVIADEAVEFDEKAVEKVLLKDDGEGLRALEELAGVLGRVEPFEAEAIEGAVKVWCEGAGVGMGKAAQPLRVAVTGGTVSPGLGETLALVGREGVLARIGRCIRACRG